MTHYTSLWRRYSGRTAARLMLSWGLVSVATCALAEPENLTREEGALLPRYCLDTVPWAQPGFPEGPSPAARRWVAVMGHGFWAIHHYCWGLANRQRALRSSTPPQTRKFLLGTSVPSDFKYVIRNTSKTFILLPEVYTALGEVELQAARPNDANNSFAQARALKPDYWPAYSYWAEFLIKSGRRGEAKELVKSGLEYSPNSKTLQEQYRLLGGKPSDIIPKVKDLPQPDGAEETAGQAFAGEVSASEAPDQSAPDGDPAQ